MQYRQACITSVGVELPPNVVSSEELETRLLPLYERLHLRVGRLELMTGIRERRFWDKGTLPSQAAAAAGRKALEKAGVASSEIGCLINCSVSRDCVEPATAAFVHHLLELPSSALAFDISNACLGMVNGIMMLANLVEMGQIEYGLAVCGENGGPLVENTVRTLCEDTTIDRKAMKGHFASLTIGSCAAGVVIGRRGHRLTHAAWCADTSQNRLCQGAVEGGMTDGSKPLMETDSEELLVRGVAVAEKMWSELSGACGWQSGRLPGLVVTHQVGKMHRQRLYESLKLPLELDYSTFERLGNCGSASLPATLGLAEEVGRLAVGQTVALLGIGSGINCCGIGVEW
ncbi:MAG: 3-oxoacyl-ACP synthase III [Victivallales bacterium]|nr:3-oxoacyl-ACP synthase III [Victivallales bacterium]